MNTTLLGSLALFALSALGNAQQVISKSSPPTAIRLVQAPANESHAYLGVQLQGDEHGVSALSVLPGSGASEAGLKAGDRIVRFGETTIQSTEELVAQVKSCKVGEQVAIGIVRAGEPMVLLAKLGERPAGGAEAIVQGAPQFVIAAPQHVVEAPQYVVDTLLAAPVRIQGRTLKTEDLTHGVSDGEVDVYMVVDRTGKDGESKRGEWHLKGQHPKTLARALPSPGKEACPGCGCKCQPQMKGQAATAPLAEMLVMRPSTSKGLAKMLREKTAKGGMRMRSPERMRAVLKRLLGQHEGRLERPEAGRFEAKVENHFRGQMDDADAQTIEELRQELRALREELGQLRQELDHGRRRGR